MERPLSELLKLWRAERPDEWTMDEFIREAEKMEKQLQNTSSNSDYAKSCDFCGDKSDAEFSICQPCLDRLIREGN